MFKKYLFITLFASFFLQVNCATTKRVPVQTFNKNDLERAKKIFIITKDKQIFKIVDFTITDSLIIGKSSASARVGIWGKERREIKIRIKNIESIVV